MTELSWEDKLTPPSERDCSCADEIVKALARDLVEGQSTNLSGRITFALRNARLEGRAEGQAEVNSK